jgi:DNA-binding transcriptional LysR family regulator
MEEMHSMVTMHHIVNATVLCIGAKGIKTNTCAAQEHIMRNQFDLNDVRSFVNAAQAETLSAAAKTLHQPASTISRSLTRLEKHLGVLLVRRGQKGLVLTDEGKQYLLSCRRALRTLNDGGELLEARRSNPSGVITVACPVTMAREIIAPLLKHFVVRQEDEIGLQVFKSLENRSEPGKTAPVSISPS